MTLPQKIKMLREQLNLSQLEFAKYLNTSQVTISRYENGTRSPDVPTIRFIIESFGLNPLWLIYDDEIDMFPDIEFTPLSEGNKNIIKDLNLMYSQEELNNKLKEILIEKILVKFKKNSNILKFLEILKLEGHLPVRPYIFLYYIFQYIDKDINKSNITSFRKYIVDIVFRYKSLSWGNQAGFTNRIKKEIIDTFELQITENECKVLVNNAKKTIQNIEGHMSSSMIKYHANTDLNNLFR